MQIFLSYAAEDRQIAEQVHLALLGAGYKVFFDRESLPAGGDYHSRIRSAVERSDIFVFLISPDSIVSGSYALTELKYARAKWQHPNGHVLPVLIRDVSWVTIPAYLKAVTILQPEGNIPAEILIPVSAMDRLEIAQGAVLDMPTKMQEVPPGINVERTSKVTVPVVVALVGLAGALGTAIIGNWDKLFSAKQQAASSAHAGLGAVNASQNSRPSMEGIPGGTQSTSRSAAEIFNSARMAVVRVRVEAKDKMEVPQITETSGFFVSKNGLLVTVAHALPDRPSSVDVPLVRISAGPDAPWTTASVISINKELDLALLQAKDPSDSMPMSIGKTIARMGDQVFLIGFPAGSTVTLLNGNLSRIEGSRIFVSAPTNVGFSGAPALDRNGDVVGVVIGRLQGGDTIVLPVNLAFGFFKQYL